MHVGYKNSHSTCDPQTSAEFQTKNLADLQIKYYRAAQAGISICCLHTLCFEISIASDVFKNNKLLFPWNTIGSTSQWNIAVFLHGDKSCGTTKAKCYISGEFCRVPPLGAGVCRVLVWLQLGWDTARLCCSLWRGRIGLAQDPAVCVTEGKILWGSESCAVFPEWKPGHWLTPWKSPHLSLLPGCAQRSELCSHKSVCLKTCGPSKASTCLVALMGWAVCLSDSGVGEAGNLVLGISVCCFFQPPVFSLSLDCYKCNSWFIISISCS